VEGFSSARQLANLMRAAKKEAGDGSFVDGMTAVQVRQRADLGTAEVLRRFADASPRSVRFRSRVPAAFRAARLRQELLSGKRNLEVRLPARHHPDPRHLDAPGRHLPGNGREFTLSAEHDARIVADAVAEWARRHGQPFTLELSGAAGGSSPKDRAVSRSASTPSSCAGSSRAAKPAAPTQSGGAVLMETRVTEVAEGVHQLTTHITEIDFGFNQYLIAAESRCSSHRHARLFPLVSDAVSRVVPLDGLRWVSFGHVEADECGSMNAFLAAAPARPSSRA